MEVDPGEGEELRQLRVSRSRTNCGCDCEGQCGQQCPCVQGIAVDSRFLLSLNDPFLIQVAFLVTKKSQENHAVAITHNVEILAADTGWFFSLFEKDAYTLFFFSPDLTRLRWRCILLK